MCGPLLVRWRQFCFCWQCYYICCILFYCLLHASLRLTISHGCLSTEGRPTACSGSLAALAWHYSMPRTCAAPDPPLSLCLWLAGGAANIAAGRFFSLPPLLYFASFAGVDLKGENSLPLTFPHHTLVTAAAPLRARRTAGAYCLRMLRRWERRSLRRRLSRGAFLWAVSRIFARDLSRGLAAAWPLLRRQRLRMAAGDAAALFSLGLAYPDDA